MQPICMDYGAKTSIGEIKMIKMIVGFLILLFVFYAGIGTFRQLSGKQKLELTKSLFYSIMCSSAAIGSIALIIFLF